jgi:hypothetical protein
MRAVAAWGKFLSAGNRYSGCEARTSRLAIPSNREAALKTRDIPTLTNSYLPLSNNGCNPPSPPFCLAFPGITAAREWADL